MTRFFFLLAMTITAPAAAQQPPPAVTVHESGSAYVVEARFDIAAPAAIVRQVLTDYAGIPRFMPDVRTSIVRSRAGNRVVVEQEAESKFLLFSRTVHLMLDVQEDAHVLTFRDLCGRSFTTYHGSWTLSGDGPVTTVVYRLSADPSFKVPGSVIKRLLDRNARQTIDHLRAEAVLRASH